MSIRFDETHLIANLRNLSIDQLVLLYDWLNLILRILNDLILRETKTMNMKLDVKIRMHQIKLAGIEAYNKSKQEKVPLLDCAIEVGKNYNIMPETVMLHARIFQKQVRIEQKEKIATLRAAGFTAREIGNKLGISASTVCRLGKKGISI